jgi:glycosyltransferase involved in cell wall biosynthesis
MTPLRLLLATDAVGGVWVYSLELARALKPLGVETVLAVLGQSPSAAQREEAAAFKLIDTGLPLDWVETSAAELRRAGQQLAVIASREGVDVLQTSSAAHLAGIDCAVPCVAVQHSCVASWWRAVKGTPLPNEFAWRRDLVAAGLQRAQAVVAPTAAFAAETAHIYQLPSPVIAVHNGRRMPVQRELPRGDFVFTAGRLWDEGKNVAALDRAAAQVSAPVQAAGSARGPNGASIRLEHVKNVGELSAARVAGLLAARPIYASAAYYEPFGLSVLEAAQTGCALVLSDIPSHRELWDGVASFVGASDDQGFARAIQELLDNPAERERGGELAQIKAESYSPRAMALAMAAIYERVAERKSVSARMAGAA